RDLDRALLHQACHLLRFQHVVERVVERTEIGMYLLVQVAWQEAEALTGLDRGPGEDDTGRLSLHQRGHRHRHGQKRLSRAGWPDREDHVVAADSIHVALLSERLRRDPLLAGP